MLLSMVLLAFLAGLAPLLWRLLERPPIPNFTHFFWVLCAAAGLGAGALLALR